MSSGGILFYTTEITLEVGQPIEYLITLPRTNGNPIEVRLHCMGKVVRRETERGAVAATLERYEFVRPDRKIVQ